MGSKTCIYMLQTIRQLQSCSSLIGMNFPRFPKTYRSEATLPRPPDTRTLRLAFSSVTVPIRSVSHESSPINQSQKMTSDWVDGPLNDSPAISGGNHVGPLNEQISLQPDEQCSTPNMPPSSTMIALNKCTTPRDVLEVFSKPSYRRNELSQGVLKLWNTFLALNEKQKLAERDVIVGHPHFHNLTHGILKMAPVMSPEASIRMLYVFVRLQINRPSTLIQNLLLRCQEHLTCLNEVELAILANTLEWLKSGTRSDKNVDLITFGLRLMIDMKIEEVNEVTPLLTMMKFIGRTAPLKLKLKLENKALQMVDRFNVAQSENLFCVLADIGFYSEHLLNACSDKLIVAIDGLSYTKIVSLLSCCCELHYGNERLLTAVGDQIMKTISLWKPRQLVIVFQYFVQLHFRHVPLLDRYAEIFTNLNSVNIWDLSETVKCYSELNHLPEKKTQFLEAVNASLPQYLNSIPRKKLIFIVYNLCVLDACPDFAVNKLLQYKSIFNCKEHRIFEHINLCLMRNTPFVRSHSFCCLKKVSPATSEDFQILHNDVKNLIKDPDLYQYSLEIANIYYMDFLLALDTQDNKLVPVGDLQTDNLQLADHSENVVRIAVLCCTPNAFALGTLHPLGKLALKIRILKSFGFSVVVIPMHKYLRMTEEHKVEYLRTMIFQELSDDQSTLEDTKAEGDLEKNPCDT